ncbi:unnamed protein product [Trichogramma brassicae]|uniref:Uncharacterized protein n=1 Tax=Trichogramma brassicae TaxID=86971 RepID=A0A6H5IES0_9HYME|nr:unnamed protein product [Trichogramma brassicae]
MKKNESDEINRDDKNHKSNVINEDHKIDEANESDDVCQTKLEQLKSAREKINWETEEERRKFLHQLYPVIEDWHDQLPNLRDIFRTEEIDWLITEEVTSKEPNTDLDPDVVKHKFPLIEFVIRTGYKDEPDVDEGGKPPSLLRTTPAHQATTRRFFCVVDSLLKMYNRFDVNYADDGGLTHFHVACAAGSYDVVKKYLELGQDVKFLEAKSGDSPLHFALENEREDVAVLLLRKGADPNLANLDGVTPLHLICQRDELEYGCDIVKTFFKINKQLYQLVQVDAQDRWGNTPLHRALKWRNQETAELLLRYGADLNLADEDGSTPLHIIGKEFDNFDISNFLFEISEEKLPLVQFDAQDKLGNTILHQALQSAHECTQRVIEFLLRRGANPNLPNKKGLTPLHIICKREDDEGGEWEEMLHADDVAKLFFKINDEIHQTVQIDARDKSGRTPLQWAVANVFPNVVGILLDHGADLSNFVFPHLSYFGKRFVMSQSDLALELASGVLAIVERLEKKGYELNRSDAMTIMKLFNKHGFFNVSVNLEDWWHARLCEERILSVYSMHTRYIRVQQSELTLTWKRKILSQTSHAALKNEKLLPTTSRMAASATPSCCRPQSEREKDVLLYQTALLYTGGKQQFD